MLERMPSGLLAEWMAYDRLDPFGNERMDINAAAISQEVYHAALGKRKAKKLGDFIVPFGGKRSKPRQSDKEMKSVAGGIARLLRKQRERKAKHGNDRHTGT